MTAHVDFETKSACDLKKHGVHVYAAHESTDVHCMAYAFDDEPVELWHPVLSPPKRLLDHIRTGGILVAHNAAFERAIWHYVMAPNYGWPEPAVAQWRCTMATAYAMALPGALEHVAAALNTGFQKDMAGHRLMMAMSKPRRARKGEPKDVVLWRDSPEDTERLYAYCKADVLAERGADARLVRLRPRELDLWHLDQRINDRGIPVDAELCRKALAVVDAHTTILDKRMARITDFEVSACSNIGQLKLFLKSRNVDTEALDREAIVELLIRPDLPDDVRGALELRQEAGKASVTKIKALLNGMSADGRARGLLQFHAARPGRWAGRRFQPHNLVRPDERFDVDGAIETLLANPTSRALDLLDTMYGPPLTCVSYILRGMIKAPPGKKIAAADFSNIEGRVIAWLGGEHKKLDAFRAYDAGTGPDLYKVAAADIYGTTHEKVSKDERQIGKVSELACGFGGGVGAFQAMAHTYGVKVPDTQAEQIKSAWRAANQKIVQLWYDLEAAAIEAVNNPGSTVQCGKLAFRTVGSFLWMRLPSGRTVCYPYPKVMNLPTPWGQMKDMLTFKAVLNVSNVRKIVPDKSNTSKWARISTYGGDISQTATEGVARDCLAEAMFRLEAAAYPIILTVHDENVAEPDIGRGSVSEFEQIMIELPTWAKGLPVAASGFESSRYRK